MSDLDRLEQLTRLREAGALTEQEFLEQKALILGSGDSVEKAKYPSWLLPSIIAVIIAFVVGTLFITRQTSLDISNATTAADDKSALRNMTFVTETDPTAAVNPPPPQNRFGYEWVTSEDILGLNPAFVESKLGPPQQKERGGMAYEVAGCHIFLTVKGTKITVVTTEVSEKCEPVIDRKRITANTTLGELNLDPWGIRSDCVENCGNSSDPDVSYFVSGTAVNGFIGYSYQAAYDAGLTDKATEAWAASIRLAHGSSAAGSASDGDWFNCAREGPPEVVNMLRKDHIISVSFGEVSDECKPST